MSGILKLSYLGHSGFAVETATKVLIFDYFQDPAGIVDAYAAAPKPLWFFVSHWHGDHFNRHMADFDEKVAHYIVNKDVKLKQVPSEKLHSMRIYDTISIDGVTITHYGSTDEGGSFLVETDGVRIFHAGDLNWWHWLGDTDSNNADAKRMYDTELAKLKGQVVQVAFFPVDARLEAAREWGVMAFLDAVKVTKCLVPMHYFGAPWEPSIAYQAKHEDVPIWIPRESGNSIQISL
jgi:L-ascorbate metabolism protein UlaG (beta-lactamase superfamily)